MKPIPGRPRVVIVGAGFAGLQAARKLSHSDADVILVDRNTYHTFIPLLYQVVAAELEPERVAYPIRQYLRRLPNVRFFRAVVNRIDFDNRQVETDGAAIPYDYLVLATGSGSKFLGVPGAPEHSLPLQTLEDAIALRNHILSCFEQAVCTRDRNRRQALLTFTIVGGGPTGVELAGALLELIQGPLQNEYPTLDLQQVRLVLVQSGDRLLADLPARLGEYTRRHLRHMGVEIHLQTRVDRVKPGAVYLENGTAIESETVIWTAGVTGVLPDSNRSLPTDGKNQLVVQPTLQLLEHPEVYVAGDLSYIREQDGSIDLVAPAAIQQGGHAGKNIQRQIKGLTPEPFRYFNKGRLAIIARNAGVGKIGKLTFTGFPAWLLWLGVHLFYLPGLRNRWLALTNWIWDYLFHERFVRLILPSDFAAVNRQPQLTGGHRRSSGADSLR